MLFRTNSTLCTRHPPGNPFQAPARPSADRTMAEARRAALRVTSVPPALSITSFASLSFMANPSSKKNSIDRKRSHAVESVGRVRREKPSRCSLSGSERRKSSSESHVLALLLSSTHVLLTNHLPPKAKTARKFGEVLTLSNTTCVHKFGSATTEPFKRATAWVKRDRSLSSSMPTNKTARRPAVPGDKGDLRGERGEGLGDTREACAADCGAGDLGTGAALVGTGGGDRTLGEDGPASTRSSQRNTAPPPAPRLLWPALRIGVLATPEGAAPPAKAPSPLFV
mmetsp:Transcript_35256/g.72602  ORF Transcript_35256/g.72602 Transcript_35256/m.72602 type:complete len:283 (+) Transcript_35256:384-1232(+)